MRWIVRVSGEDDEGYDTIQLFLPSENDGELEITYKDTYYCVEMLQTVKRVPETSVEAE